MPNLDRVSGTLPLLASVLACALAAPVESQALVKDINTTAPSVGSGSYPYYFASAGPFLLFGAEEAGSGNELWRTLGTAASTQLVADIWPGAGGSYPSELISAGAVVYFSAD